MKPLALLPLVFAALPALASTITYNVTQTGPKASASGTIITDGTLGLLQSANILGYNLTVSVAASSETVGKGIIISSPAQTDTFGEGGVFLLEAPLTATASGLFYDFGNPKGGYADFSDSADQNTAFNSLCLSGFACSGGDPGFSGVSVFVNNEYSEVLPLSGENEFATASMSSAVTPEPSSLLLLGTGALALAFTGARHRFV